jgi:hypothetical protein
MIKEVIRDERMKGVIKGKRMMKGAVMDKNNGERSVQELKDDEGDERNDQERK